MNKQIFKLSSLMLFVVICFTACNNCDMENIEVREPEIHSKLTLSQIIDLQKAIINRFYGQTRSAEELISEEEAKVLLAPFVEDGKYIRTQLLESIENKAIEISHGESLQLSEMTEEQLAGLSFAVSNLNNPNVMSDLFNEIEIYNIGALLDNGKMTTSYTKAELWDCLTFTLGFSTVGSLYSYFTGTAGLITARTAWELATAFGSRTFGWVGLVIVVYEYTDCLRSKHRQ